MPNKHTEFWLAFLNCVQNRDKGARLWNGYLGWKLPPGAKADCKSRQDRPHSIVEPPKDGWPELTEEEKEIIETLARENGGHPAFDDAYAMDFSGLTLPGRTDLSGWSFTMPPFVACNLKER